MPVCSAKAKSAKAEKMDPVLTSAVNLGNICDAAFAPGIILKGSPGKLYDTDAGLFGIWAASRAPQPQLCTPFKSPRSDIAQVISTVRQNGQEVTVGQWSLDIIMD